MAIKALKQSVSISETQKMIHQWKAKGITDSATLKLLDLYLGLTPYMTAEGIYPMRNLYQICQSMKTTHTTTLLENIRKTRHGQSLMEQAVARLSSELSKDLEEKRRKLREFRPVSPFEWKDAGTDIRYYDDPIDGKVEIPENAPPRPVETAIWNVLSKEWIDTGD